MKLMTSPFKQLFPLLFFLALFPAFSQAQNNLFFNSDGIGTVHISWPPADNYSPDHGWQLRRLKDHELVAEWKPDQRRQELEKIAPEKADSINEFLLNAQKSGSEQQKTVVGLISLAAATDFEMAKALGLGCSFKTKPGAHRYRLAATDKKGAEVTEIWISPPIDSSNKSALPLPPTTFTAESKPDGVALFWTQTQEASMPVVGLLVERDGPQGTWHNLAGSPGATFLPAKNDDPAAPDYRDRRAPLETEINYRIAAIDPFGRRSPFIAAKVFHADHQALQPPNGLLAQAQTNMVTLSWTRHTNPFTSGYLLERKLVGTEIFRPLTPKGLPADTITFSDKEVTGGRNYQYRIRAIGPRGKIGPASTDVIITPKTDGPPPPPEKLVAHVNPIKVLLAWKAPEKAYVSGYVLERRPSDSKDWTRITPSHHTVTWYEDNFPLGTVGSYSYRVRSVGADSRKGTPSDEVDVTLEGRPEVVPPFLHAIDGKDGKVSISFKPGNPTRPPMSYLVVRGTSPQDQGLVIGAPIDGDERSYTDTMVRPGEDYWYGLIAVDKEENRSEISDKLLVRVGPKKIPQPGKPSCTLEEKPFRRIIITFDEPPEYLKAVIVRKTDQEDRWQTLADNLGSGGEIVDTAPPKSGEVSYAVMYKTDNNIHGELSKPGKISMD